MNRVALSLTGAAFGLGFASNYAYESINSYFLQKYHTDFLNHRLESLPAYRKLLDPASGHKLEHPWQTMTTEQMAIVFNVGALHSPGALPLAPVMFSNKQTNATQTFLYFGHRLAGFPFLVHGGILGTAIDEAIHRTAAMTLGEYPQSHLNIKLTYKRPTFVNQFLVIKASTTTNANGQLQINAQIETLKGKKLVQGTGVFCR